MEFWGLLCFVAVAFPVFCLVWVLIVGCIRPRHGCLWSGVSAPAFFVVLVSLMALESCYESLPTVVFRRSFGFAPTPDIKILHSCRILNNKWDEAYLEFYADESTINRVLQNGYAAISADDIIERYSAPTWWKPSTTPGVRIYATHTDDPEYHGEHRYFFNHELLIYEPATKKAYARYRRIAE